MSSLTRKLIPKILIFCMLVVTGYSELVFQHSGSTDPVSEGWLPSSNLGSPVGDITAGPINDSGTQAWYVDDSSTAIGSTLFYGQSPTENQINEAKSSGWVLSIQLRVVDAPDSPDTSVFAAYRYDNTDYHLAFGAEADGDPIVRLLTASNDTGIDYTLQNSGGGYHLYQLVYDPVASSADLFVDGVERLSDYTGYSLSTSPVVLWGGGASTSTGHGNYNSVQLDVIPEPASPILMIAGGLLLARGRRYRMILNACSIHLCGR
jgi:hypothetical protein